MSGPIKRATLSRIMEKLMTKNFSATQPAASGPELKAGALYRFKEEHSTWTDNDGWLWTFTGDYESKPGDRLVMPVFRAVATGHEEWLPLDWMEELVD